MGVREATIEISSLAGLNTAKTFSEIVNNQSPKMLNMVPRKTGGLANRDGTIPLTTAALGSPIKSLANLRKAGVNSILAAAGTTLYKYGSGTLTAQTMTNPLNSAVISSAAFKDASSAEVLVIADGSNLKYYNGTAVANITPAADDTSLPANVLATINSTMPSIGVTVWHNRLVVWGNNSDQINHSKIGYYDYFRQTDYQRWVKENDYVVACAPFSGALLVFMRRHIGVLYGDGYSSTPSSGDWAQDFLDTSDGCVNARSVALVIYPDGREEIFYQSDRGVHAVYTIDTVSLNSGARYSTKSMTKDLINFQDLGVTKTEWAAATSYFYDGKYWLVYKKGSVWQGLVFDTSSGQWYPVDNISSNDFYNDEDYFYFVGDHGHLKVFDSSLYSDWNETTKATGTPINKYWYSKLLTFGITGLDHFWDILLVEARQFYGDSTIDLEVNTYRDRFQQVGAIKTEIFVIGKSKIGQAQIENPYLTDAINNAKQQRVFAKGQYAQINLSNSRDEPIEIFSLIWNGRKMSK